VKRLVEYVERVHVLERLAALEEDGKLKADLQQLVGAYRSLAEHRAKMLNIPLPEYQRRAD
jgi:hypothetical protein